MVGGEIVKKRHVLPSLAKMNYLTYIAILDTRCGMKFRSRHQRATLVSGSGKEEVQ
jgi:hypothetical protein